MSDDAPTATAARRRYKPKLFADAKYHERELQKAAAQAIKQYQALHKDELSKFRVLKPKVAVRVRSPGAPQVLKAIIRHILSSDGATATQAAIRRAVEQQFPQYAVYKDWTHPIPEYARKYAASLLPASEPAFRSLEVPRIMSLRELHAKSKVAFALHGGHARTYRADISLASDSVFINGRAFSISSTKTGKYTYHFIRIAMPSLEEALGTGTVNPKIAKSNA